MNGYGVEDNGSAFVPLIAARHGAGRAYCFEIEGIQAGQRGVMIGAAEKRGHIIRHLEEALALADEIEDGNTGFLIERALDEARAHQFTPVTRSSR
jgi:hypothetical protein